MARLHQDSANSTGLYSLRIAAFWIVAITTPVVNGCMDKNTNSFNQSCCKNNSVLVVSLLACESAGEFLMKSLQSDCRKEREVKNPSELINRYIAEWLPNRTNILRYNQNMLRLRCCRCGCDLKAIAFLCLLFLPEEFVYSNLLTNKLDKMYFNHYFTYKVPVHGLAGNETSLQNIKCDSKFASFDSLSRSVPEEHTSRRRSRCNRKDDSRRTQKAQRRHEAEAKRSKIVSRNATR